MFNIYENRCPFWRMLLFVLSDDKDTIVHRIVLQGVQEEQFAVGCTRSLGHFRRLTMDYPGTWIELNNA